MVGVLFVIVACVLWAVDTLFRYPLLKLGEQAEFIVFAEHLLLVFCCLPILYRARQKILETKLSNILHFLAIGGFGSAIGTLAFTKAFTLINPSLVILLQKLQPLVAIFLARIYLKEPLRRQYFFWAGLCLVGGLMISFKDLWPGANGLSFDSDMASVDSIIGYSLALLAVVSWGSSTVFGKKLSTDGYSEKEIMSGRFLMGMICLTPVVMSGELEWQWAPEFWSKIFVMVVLSGLLGMYFYYQGLKRLPARLCALAEMFFPFCAIGVNWVFLGATLDSTQLLGGGLLLIGSTVIQIKHY
ncbi:MAG: DMT family transporter [Halobacteriovoraceae bacterium]|jgi:drug/metabolite transporter (DMT)-like permease|nr:DMT family transporter [Halobacteriovoraceae bacterium]